MNLTSDQFTYLKQLSKLDFELAEEQQIQSELQEFLEYISIICRFAPSTSMTLKSETLRSLNISYTPPKIKTKECNAILSNEEFNYEDVAIKANILCKGKIALAGSNMLRNHIASYDSKVVENLKNSGYTIGPVTNMDEFAMGHDSSTSYSGRVLNPFDIKRSAGGSSGGSCALVAAGLSRYALGSDTGGSIRQPAAYMGLVGLKPTYNSVSRYGLISYASSFDQIGPITRTVSDNRNLYNAIAEVKMPDLKDSDYKILVPDNLLALCVNSDSIIAAARSISGGEVIHFDMPYLDELISCYYVIACAECSSNLSRFDEDRYMNRNDGFGFEVKKRILLGNYCLSHGFFDSYYLKAIELRSFLTNVIDELTKDNSYIVLPVTRTTAPIIGDELDPLQKYKDDIFTVIASISGNPAITVPCGNDSDGLPIGVQIIGSKFSESGLYHLAELIENKVGGFL